MASPTYDPSSRASPNNMRMMPEYIGWRTCAYRPAHGQKRYVPAPGGRDVGGRGGHAGHTLLADFLLLGDHDQMRRKLVLPKHFVDDIVSCNAGTDIMCVLLP